MLHPLGRIIKTHGYHGTVVLVADQPLNDEMEGPEELFVVIDGLQVPFPVEDFTLITDTSAHVQLEFINNCDEASGLVSCEAYTTVAPQKQEQETAWEQWIGFTVHDAKCGKIGVIRQIEDYKGNIVLQLIEGGRETLISFYPELVTHIDNDEKILYIAMPDGYF